MAYTAEKRLSKHPERFGKGTIEGVAAPENANNAATGGAIIPMMTLGIPGSGTTAVLLVVLMMYGIQPGPRLMIEHPQVMWTVIASLYTSNVILGIRAYPRVDHVASHDLVMLYCRRFYFLAPGGHIHPRGLPSVK